MVPRQVDARTFGRLIVDWVKNHLVKTILMAVLGFAIGWAVNTLIIGFRYDGFVAPSGGSVATAEGKLLVGGVYWTLLSMVLISFLTYGITVGWGKTFTDLASLPATVSRVFRESQGRAWSVVLWGAAMMLLISSVLAPAISGVLGIGLLVAAPTALSGILGRLVTRAWAGLIGLFAPQKKPAIPGLGGSLVGVGGSAVGMLIAAQSDSVALKLIGAAVLAVGAYLIVARPGPAVTTGILLLAAASLGIYVAFKTGIALADDGGWTEFRQANPDAGFWDWLNHPDTQRVIDLARAGGVFSGLGAGAGVSIGSVLAGLQQLPGVPPGWLPEPEEVLSPGEAMPDEKAESPLDPLPDDVVKIDEAIEQARGITRPGGPRDSNWSVEHEGEGIRLTPHRPAPPEIAGIEFGEPADDGSIRLEPADVNPYQPYGVQPVPEGYQWDIDEGGHTILVPDPDWYAGDPSWDEDRWDAYSNEDGSISLVPKAPDEAIEPPPDPHPPGGLPPEEVGRGGDLPPPDEGLDPFPPEEGDGAASEEPDAGVGEVGDFPPPPDELTDDAPPAPAPPETEVPEADPDPPVGEPTGPADDTPPIPEPSDVPDDEGEVPEDVSPEERGQAGDVSPEDGEVPEEDSGVEGGEPDGESADDAAAEAPEEDGAGPAVPAEEPPDDAGASEVGTSDEEAAADDGGAPPGTPGGPALSHPPAADDEARILDPSVQLPPTGNNAEIMLSGAEAQRVLDAMAASGGQRVDIPIPDSEQWDVYVTDEDGVRVRGDRSMGTRGVVTGIRTSISGEGEDSPVILVGVDPYLPGGQVEPAPRDVDDAPLPLPPELREGFGADETPPADAPDPDAGATDAGAGPPGSASPAPATEGPDDSVAPAEAVNGPGPPGAAQDSASEIGDATEPTTSDAGAGGRPAEAADDTPPVDAEGAGEAAADETVDAGVGADPAGGGTTEPLQAEGAAEGAAADPRAPEQTSPTPRTTEDTDPAAPIEDSVSVSDEASGDSDEEATEAKAAAEREWISGWQDLSPDETADKVAEMLGPQYNEETGEMEPGRLPPETVQEISDVVSGASDTIEFPLKLLGKANLLFDVTELPPPSVGLFADGPLKINYKIEVVDGRVEVTGPVPPKAAAVVEALNDSLDSTDPPRMIKHLTFAREGVIYFETAVRE